MAYPDNQGFLYVIAGGETLQMLDKLKTDAEAAKQALEKIAQDLGAKISFDPHDSMFTFTGALPAGWEKFETRGGTMFNPDRSTKEGQTIGQEIDRQSRKMSIRDQFSEACAQHCGTCRYNSTVYSFEQIGDKIIVRCPIGHVGQGQPDQYFIPPDSTPITFSAYVKMKEDAGLLPVAVVNVFKNKFEL